MTEQAAEAGEIILVTNIGIVYVIHSKLQK